jgi:hypothetical protein
VHFEAALLRRDAIGRIGLAASLYQHRSRQIGRKNLRIFGRRQGCRY